MAGGGGEGGRELAEHAEGLESGWTGTELLPAHTMARYGPCILRNWMMKEGPPATIWGGRWLRGQFSMLMMDSLLQRASSKGRLCRLGLSLRYSSSKFSSVPEDNHQVRLEPPATWAGLHRLKNNHSCQLEAPFVTTGAVWAPSVVSAVLTDLLWKVLQQVLPQAEVGQVGEVADASG